MRLHLLCLPHFQHVLLTHCALFNNRYLFLYFKNIKTDNASAIDSAAGVASQIPFTPKISGNTIIVISINTNDLENARTAEIIPLDNTVNIPLLRELEVPVHAIQNFMKNRSAQSLKNLLDDKIADLDSQLMHLQTIRTTLCTQRQHMITLMTMDLSEIRIRADYCRNGKLPFLTYQSAMHTTPGGKYLRAFHKGNWDKIPERYEEIFAYAQTHNLVLYGYSYEMGINETVIDNIEDYIVQIEIPVTEI